MILAVSCLLLQNSCYEDKGNYDYQEMNDIEIDLNLEKTNHAIGSLIELTPVLTCKKGVEPKNLSFSWKYEGKEISTERKLAWTANVKASSELMLYVTDNDTGVKYVSSTRLNIVSKYALQGWFVLSELNGESCLSFIETESKITVGDNGDRTITGTTDIDAYKKMNGSSLGSQPVKLLEHFRKTQYDADDNLITDENVGSVWVVQKGGQGTVDLAGNTLLKDLTLEENFINGKVPAGFVPYDMIDMTFFTLVVSEDGKVYTRVKETADLYNSGKFIEQPLSFEGKLIDGRNMVWSQYYNIKYTMFYDAPTNRYLLITCKDEMAAAGRIAKIDVSENDYNTNPSFSRLDNLGDKKPIYIGAYSTGSSSEMGYMAILKSDIDNKTYAQNFILSSAEYSETASATLVGQQEINLSSVIDGVSRNVFHKARWGEYASFMFISKGRELWYFKTNVSNPVLTKFCTLDADILTMCTEVYGSRQVGVGLADGQFQIIDISPEALNGLYGDKVVLYKARGLGDIAHVRYKVTQGNRWSIDMW